VLLPSRLRPAVRALYAFARHADDLADEGDADNDQRLAALRAMDDALCGTPNIAGPALTVAPGVAIVKHLKPHLLAHGLPIEPLRHLLSAFMQDVTVKRYADRAALVDYCSRSANPVGRLMLHLFGFATPQNIALSDSICTALQLINFLQDIRIDHQKDRIYLPQDALARFELSASDLAQACHSEHAPTALRRLIADEAERARGLLLMGAPLCHRLPLRLGLEIRAIVAGGLRIIQRLGKNDFDPLANRPALGAMDAPALLWLALRMPK
jgi:squalene synthase HpnC